MFIPCFDGGFPKTRPCILVSGQFFISSPSASVTGVPWDQEVEAYVDPTVSDDAANQQSWSKIDEVRVALTRETEPRSLPAPLC